MRPFSLQLRKSVNLSKIATNNHEEYQYLNAIKDIISNGYYKENRTGIPTRSLFGKQFRFNLSNDNFPLLTTKKVAFKAIIEELLWFIRGSTDANELSSRGVRIWQANGSRQFLDKLGFTERREGDLGPVYGFQWRHFGADYVDCSTDYSDQGFDQLKNIITTIRRDPNNRRLVMSAWNPVDIPKMVLPPCHVLLQFYVADNRLSCQLYQRSADMGLGVPFNIASYALLARMVAHVTNLGLGDFVHTIGDAHVYENHIEPLKIQIKREPRPFPKLRLAAYDVNEIDDFKLNSFELVYYRPHPKIVMDMAV